MKDDSYALILAYFEKTIDDDGVARLQDWIEQSPENLAQFNETIQILDASRSYHKAPLHPQARWSKISAHINSEAQPIAKRTNGVRWMFRTAACLVVCLTAWLLHKPVLALLRPQVNYQSINNPDGKRLKVTLPDGSTVVLAGGSSLKYPDALEGSKREVVLNGEAFFDVVHNEQLPFLVKSGRITTVVLGTSFNVKAYAADGRITVTVSTGRVGIMSNRNGRNALVKYLTPNQQISINTGNGLFTSGRADAAAATGWITNKLVFYNTTYRDIARSMEHQYGVKVNFTDAAVGDMRLTAQLNNMTLKQSMETLSLLSGLGYTQNGNQIYIAGNDEKGGTIMK